MNVLCGVREKAATRRALLCRVFVCKEEEDELEEDDLQVMNVVRKSRRSSRRLDHAVPCPVTSCFVLFTSSFSGLLYIFTKGSWIFPSEHCLFSCTFPGACLN